MSVVSINLEDVVRLAVQDGDVLFVNNESVDIEIMKQWRFGDKKFFIVPVYVPHGKTVADCLAVANKATALPSGITDALYDRKVL